jgi:phospholipid/cholesterol/gamma-HCH transport system substrate-binding protein
MMDVSKRLTERMSRARAQVELKRSARPLAVLAVGALVALAMWIVIIANVGSGLLRSEYTVKFGVDAATSVTPGRNPVKLHGVEVGRITGVELEDGRPVLTAKIESEHGPIYRDARAELRPETALENMYLDIVDRGTKAAGPASGSGPLPARQTGIDVQVEEVLSAFSPDVRRRLNALMGDLGGGLDGRGADLREAFVQLVPFVEAIARMSAQLGDRAALTRRLVSDLSVLTGELGHRDRDLRTLVEEGGRTLATLGASSGDLDATLSRLPPALGELDASFAAVRGVVDDVDRALVDLRPVADRLPRGLSDLRRLSVDADPALRALRRPVRRLVPLATALKPLAARLDDALRALGPQVGAVHHVTRTTAGCRDALNDFFQWTASVTKFDDGRAQFPRGNATMSLNTFGTTTKDPNQSPAAGCSPGTPKVAEP